MRVLFCDSEGTISVFKVDTVFYESDERMAYFFCGFCIHRVQLPRSFYLEMVNALLRDGYFDLSLYCAEMFVDDEGDGNES